MARLFEDGFDMYGSDELNMTDGVYANAGGATLSTAHPGTGTHGVFINIVDDNTAVTGLRKVLPASTTKMGAMGRFYYETLPQANTVSVIYDFLSGDANKSHVACFVDTNGRLLFRKGGNTAVNGEVGTVIATSDPLIGASSQNHIEVQVYVHATDGWVRAAINGVHRFEATGLDTLYDSSGIVSVAQHLPYYGSASIYDGSFYMDDLVYYDFAGTPSTDTDFCPTYDGSGKATGYIGDLQVMWLPPNADTAENDWLPITGTDSYAMVDEVDPNDNDYIYSNDVGDLTELALTDLPPEITYIRGLTVWGRMAKSDAGAAMIKFGMKSVAATYDAPERPLTVEPTYWWDQCNTDPNSSTRWTRPTLNAAWMRLTRSA